MIATTTLLLPGAGLIDYEPLIIEYLVWQIVPIVVDKENSSSAQLAIHGNKTAKRQQLSELRNHSGRLQAY